MLHRLYVALEDLSWQVDRTARVWDIDNAAHPTLYRSCSENDIRLFRGITTCLEVLDSIQTGILVSNMGIHVMMLILLINGNAFEYQEVGITRFQGAGSKDGVGHLKAIDAIFDEFHLEIDETRHLNSATEGNLAIPLREVQVPHRQVCALHVDREVDARATRQILDIAVATMLAWGHRTSAFLGRTFVGIALQ